MRSFTIPDWRRGLAALLGVLLAAAPLGAQKPPSGAGEADPAQRGVGDETKRTYAPWPQPDNGYITDLAGVLTPMQEEGFEQYLWFAEASSGVEIAVLIINSMGDYPDAGAGAIEDFARGVFNAWGVGNLPANDGVLLLVAINDRRARIELGAGYGTLRDGDAQRIMDNAIIPHFKRGDYAGGISAGIRALGREFASVRYGTNWTVIVAGALGVLAIPVGISLYRNGKRGWGWVLIGLGVILLLYVVKTLRATSQFMEDYSPGGGSSGGFGGGFGGGSSGGGGASGSW